MFVPFRSGVGGYGTHEAYPAALSSHLLAAVIWRHQSRRERALPLALGAYHLRPIQRVGPYSKTDIHRGETIWRKIASLKD